MRFVTANAQRALSLACVLACVILVEAAAADPSPRVFFVATDGSDSNPGTQAAPFRSVARAQAAVRALSAKTGGVPDQPVQVVVGNGTYHLAAPLQFGYQDSGSAANRITYMAAPGASPVLSGGMVVDGWKESVTALHSGSAARVWTAQLPSTTQYFRQLWVDGQRRTLARTPVMAYAKATHTYIVTKAGQLPSTTPHNPNDVTVVLYESWTASVHQIRSIDAANLTVFLSTTYNNEWSGSAAGSRYYFQNMIEALDTPGEFYYDRVSHILTYLPMADEKLGAVTAVIPQLTELMIGTGDSTSTPTRPLQFVTFANLTFSHSMVDVSDCFAGSCDGQSASFLTTATLRFNTSSNIVLDGITVSHTGGYAIWFNRASFSNVVQYAHIFDSGAGGVRLGPPQGGVEAAQALRNINNVVRDSVLENGGFYYQEGCGVLAQQVANASIVHNRIEHWKYTGVSVGWTWGYAPTSVGNNTVGWNRINDIGQDTLSDMGCVYTLGIQYGTVIENNICSDVWSYNYGGWGYYTDEGSSNITNTNNIVYGTKCAGYHQHYGLDNHMVNNIVFDVNKGNCDGAVRSSQHPGKCVLPAKGEAQGRCSSFRFDTNIVMQPSGPIFMSTIPTGFQNMSFANNTYWRETDASGIVFPMDKTFAEWKAEGKDVYSVISNPLFVNGTALNFNLESKSPALVEGFVQIDTSTVGPRPRNAFADASWFQLPSRR